MVVLTAVLVSVLPVPLGSEMAQVDEDIIGVWVFFLLSVNVSQALLTSSAQDWIEIPSFFPQSSLLLPLHDLFYSFLNKLILLLINHM